MKQLAQKILDELPSVRSCTSVQIGKTDVPKLRVWLTKLQQPGVKITTKYWQGEFIAWRLS